MSLRHAARIARRELRGGLRGFGIFLACLALGVAAISGIGSVRAAIEAGLVQEGAALLGGDAEIELTYRFASETELDWMQANATEVSEIADFRSMAVVGDDRALTQVKSVDDAYPLVGTVTLSPDMPLDQALAGEDTLPGAVMDRVLADRLGLTPGNEFALGGTPFRLSAILVNEPDNATGGFGLGPRTMVATSALAESNLLSPGTLFETQYRLRLPPGSDLAAYEAKAKAELPKSGLRWRDARNGAPGVATFVERLSAFLVLVGLSGLAVGGVGVSAAVRAYLSAKAATIATLRTLGATNGTVFLAYALQIAALSALGIAIGLALGGLVPLALAPILQTQLPVPAIFSLYPAPLFEAALYGALTAALFTLWPLARTESIRAATLFRDAMGAAARLPRARYILATLALLTVLIGTAGAFSGSFRLTGFTALGLLGALLLLGLSAALARFIARRLRPLAQGRPALRWALAAISGPRSEALPVVLSLGLGLTVLATVGQLDGNLRGAIARDLPTIAPSYFFVDIQKDQMPGFTEQLEGDSAVSKIENAPMLRGVISHINNRPAREVAGEHWVVQGDRGITYATDIPDNTRVVAGNWWGSGDIGPPQVSFAAEEAEEMGLSLGDTLTVNVMGRDIEATITSFREVDFSTAGMGFVMIMDPASVSAAPHTYIATVYAEPDHEARILRELSQRFPNITAIRVKDAIARVTEMLSSLASATAWGASATLLTGFLVLIGAAAAGSPARAHEAAVLKTLGATRRRILSSFLIRSGLLGLAAGTVALIAGITGGWAVCHFVFDTDFAVIWPSGLAIILGGVAATLLASAGFALRALATRPARTLRSRE
ncbi:FtsX-like permease family protein [Alisedimentitalea sp. MJ-SS2]|uniref:ABC transporter permease n=1 Tax=Aliisedimentitalea sp. MJ-SS2 TaxID=3049795 RepID=UPI0029099BC7|nr:FtsX-like permease family protein [Alisedimentitalea sp. MJ-SS2]MDU8928951.1 FtsX-like permease family protein [Alisedimentitalea sp. MJ-SS2]